MAWLDLALCLSLLAIALAIRLPNLVNVPLLTDETEEIRRAVRLARGEGLPLVNVDAYIGAWNLYLTALALHLGGFSVATARSVTLACAGLTVVATYSLARALGLGRPTAGLGGLLLAASGAQAVVGSHVAWSNCTSPLYTTLAALLLTRAQRQRQPRGLVLAGLVGGVGLQTHPSVLALLGALGLVGLETSRRQGWLRSRWPLLALAAGLLGYSPVLLYNLQHGFRAVHRAMEMSSDYQAGKSLTLAIYLHNLRLLLVGLGQVLGSSFVPLEQALRDPAVWIAAGLALAGLGWALRRGWALLPLSLLSVVLLLPLFNPKYNLVMNGRYLLPLLPLVVVAQAGLAADLVRWALARLEIPPERISPTRRAAACGLLLLVVGLTSWALASPLARLRQYELAQPPTNSDLLRLAAAIEAQRRPDEIIWIDSGLRGESRGSSFSRGRTLSLQFEIDRVPHLFVHIDQLADHLALERSRGVLLVARPTAPLPAPILRLQPVPLGWSSAESDLAVVLYRIPPGLFSSAAPGLPVRGPALPPRSERAAREPARAG